MKKTAVLGAVFFIILSQIYADENLIDFKNLYFNWQLVSYTTGNQKSDFLNLNPIFFSNPNGYFLMNNFENIDKNNNSQNKQAKSTNSQETRFCLLGTIMLFTAELFTGYYDDRQEQDIYNSVQKQDAQKQQEEMEKIYQKIYPNNRNY
ncbi:MAG: hypothetical protein LBB89_01995 [Treponema sp.]|jgi:hypothetical protein|nr:hypothetical protein [Treponema sp.]